MDLRLKDKMSLYEAQKPLLAAVRLNFIVGDVADIRRQIRHAEMQHDAVQRTVGNGMKLGGEDAKAAIGYHLYYGAPLQDQLDELRAESFDSPKRCSADFYQAVIESLGFERVATYDVMAEKANIFARPDGAFLVWNTETEETGHVMRGAALLAFQWVGYEDADKPEGVSGEFHRAANQSWIYEGTHDAREGIAQTIEKLLEGGNFCSPYPSHTDTALLDALISPLDWKHLRETMQAQPGFTDRKLINEMHYVADQRYKDLPLWAQQMLRPMKFEDYYLAAKGLNLGP